METTSCAWSSSSDCSTSSMELFDVDGSAAGFGGGLSGTFGQGVS